MRRAMPGLAAFGSFGFNRRRGLIRACVVVVAAGLLLLFAGDAAFATLATYGAPTAQQAAKETNDLAKVLAPQKMDSTEPMLLQADEMVYDNENNRVTAKGNVEIYYGNYTLLADQVIYDRNANTLAAAGNVSIKDPEGAIITSDHMTLTDDFRDGFINALRVVTKEDTRIVATTATREAGNVTVYEKGWFTPCKPCEATPDRPPAWRIRAKKIIHRTDQATITFRNAFFDFFGVPVLWVPYFQSADPTVKRKSGFLMPSYQSSSNRFGTAVTVPYYFALSDNYDFTFIPMFTSQAGVLLQGVWRQRTASGAYNVDVAGVFDNGTFASPFDGNFRGSINTAGKFALDPYWSWGWDAVAVSDDTFRRFYNLDSLIKTDTVSQLYLEGLDDRNYFGMRFYETGDLLTTRDPLADATVYPIIDYDYIVHNPVIGGELSFNSNVMALSNADGTDSNRLIVEANWRRQLIDPIGEVFTPFAQLRGDLYDVNAFVASETNLESGGPILRGNAVAGAEYRYPFIATTGSVTHLFEPIAQIIVRPDSVGDQSQIPNEDAQSLVFDDTILFDIDKFSGYDRMETGTRANVGFRYTAQLPNGAYARAVFGESYQLAGQNSFDLPAFQNSGLATTASDYVSGLYLQAASYLSFSAQARFDQQTLDLERTDLGSNVHAGPLNFSVNYAQVAPQVLSAATIASLAPVTTVTTTTTGTTTTTAPLATNQPAQQEIQGRGALSLTDTWALLFSARYDLQNAQMIGDGVGLRYQNDCLTIAVTYEESHIEDRDILPGQTITVNIALKYLGSYAYASNVAGLVGPDTANVGF
jgi:LPS-assembly protein